MPILRLDMPRPRLDTPGLLFPTRLPPRIAEIVHNAIARDPGIVWRVPGLDLLEVNEQVRPEALQALLEREIGPETKDTIVTAGQQLIEQGRQQGIQQGIQPQLLRQLRQRFGVEVDPHVEQRIATDSVEQFESWSGRVLTAATLAELLAD